MTFLQQISDNVNLEGMSGFLQAILQIANWVWLGRKIFDLVQGA